MSKKYNKIIRDSENYYDEVDSETQFRGELVKREKLMREQEKKNPIKSKFGDYNERITKKWTTVKESVIKYKVVEVDSGKELATRVEMWHSEGWRLVGGVSFAVYGMNYYCQAMIKE